MSDQVRNQNVGFLMTQLTLGKNLSKTLLWNKWADFHETNLCSIGELGPIIVYSNDDTLLTFIYFVAWSLCICNIGFSIGKSENIGLFKKPIAACDLKVGRCRRLINLMKVCDY